MRLLSGSLQAEEVVCVTKQRPRFKISLCKVKKKSGARFEGGRDHAVGALPTRFWVFAFSRPAGAYKSYLSNPWPGAAKAALCRLCRCFLFGAGLRLRLEWRCYTGRRLAYAYSVALPRTVPGTTGSRCCTVFRPAPLPRGGEPTWSGGPEKKIY